MAKRGDEAVDVTSKDKGFSIGKAGHPVVGHAMTFRIANVQDSFEAIPIVGSDLREVPM